MAPTETRSGVSRPTASLMRAVALVVGALILLLVLGLFLASRQS